MSELLGYINIIVWGMCLCIGYVLKSMLTKFPNRFIPLSMLIIGVLISVILNKSSSPDVILNGMLSGLMSIGSYEVFKNTIKKVQ